VGQDGGEGPELLLPQQTNLGEERRQ